MKHLPLVRDVILGQARDMRRRLADALSLLFAKVVNEPSCKEGMEGSMLHLLAAVAPAVIMLTCRRAPSPAAIIMALPVQPAHSSVADR